jgi:long-chain acyl-CoA synthetase
VSAINSPLEAFLHWEKSSPNQVFLNQPIDSKSITYTFKEVGDEVRKVAAELKALNLPDKSHIALLSKNCAHWTMSDLAIMMAGYVSIPIYPTLNAESIQQILTHSESRAIIVGKLDDFKNQEKGIPEIPIISIGLYGESKGKLWETIIETQKGLEDSEITFPHSEDLHTIIYTSGTTGTPKGVMHTVGNFMISTTALIPVTETEFGSKIFSYLPMAHIAERLIETISIRVGAEVFFPESLATFANDLSNTQPDVFFGVPRIYAKFQEKVLEKLPQKKLNTLFKIPLINTIIKKKIRTKLGLGNAKVVVSGAAPLSRSTMDWYQSIGITIRQIYGMTEDGCVSHFNFKNENKAGTVGKVFKETKIKISPDGELLIKNDCLMKGYFKAPELTASVFDDEGYFKTGDKGEYDHDGFLTITGRAKDEFKTDKGKYVSPASLELTLSKNTDIENICVVGTGIPQPIALVTLSDSGKLKTKVNIVSCFKETLKTTNPSFEKHEKIEKIIIMSESWNLDNGLITPTLKVKRNAIEKLHQQFYQSWFAMDDKVIFE